MAAKTSQPPEPRNETVGVRCTASEKQDVRLVAAFDQSSESDTLREYTMAQVRERAEDIRSGKAKRAA